MNFSDLVAYQNELHAMSISDAMTDATRSIDRVMHVSGRITIDNFNAQLRQRHVRIQNEFDGFAQVYEQLKQQTQAKIQEQEPYWYEESAKLYQQGLKDSDEYLLGRRCSLSEPAVDMLQERVKLYTNWKHAGLIIRPGLEPFMPHMVGLDPLYIADQSYEMLFPCMLEFPEQYQKRLRACVVKDSVDQPMMTQIPDNQIGMCLVYNFFNFKPINIIEAYLREIYQKLKPGGILALTFNDCDNSKAVQLVERYYCMYTPGKRIHSIIDNIGYEQLFKWTDGPLTWLELQKPGELTSIRGGQALAKVVKK